MDITKFVNKKKNVLPPRPKPPTVDQIMQDLKHTPENDTAYSLLKYGKNLRESKINQDKLIEENPNMNNPEQVYQIIKSYLDTSKNLSVLEDSIITEEMKLYTEMENMKILAEDFKKQAHAALLT